MYPVFLVTEGKVSHPTPVKVQIAGGQVEILALAVGERGRGRSAGILPVENAPRKPCPDQGKEVFRSSASGAATCPKCGTALPPAAEDKYYATHPPAGTVLAPIAWGELGTTRSGAAKLIAAVCHDPSPAPSEAAIVVWPLGIGFRGSNEWSGDRTGRWRIDSWNGRPEPIFAPWPVESRILTEGRIAQGDAGRAGSGTQKILVLPAGVIVRTQMNGRRVPPARYWLFDGETIHSATWAERRMLPDDHPLAAPEPQWVEGDLVCDSLQIPPAWEGKILQAWESRDGYWERGSKGTLVKGKLDEGWETGNVSLVPIREGLLELTTSVSMVVQQPLDSLNESLDESPDGLPDASPDESPNPSPDPSPDPLEPDSPMTAALRKAGLA